VIIKDLGIHAGRRLMDTEFRFKMLGPLEVEHSGTDIRLGGFRQQTLLAMLLLEVNRPVRLDRLVDAIWNNAPPRTARNQVRICVSALRRQFAEAGRARLIETHRIGYLLRVPRGTLDLHCFEKLVALGRAAADEHRMESAVGLLRSALDLWRGPIASGLNSALVCALSAKLHEEHLTVLEECFDLELRLGRHRRIVGDLVSYVAAYPFRERLCAQLMLGLYRSCRQADALETFRNTRQRLVEDLGIEPGEELRTLEHSILVNDPRLDAQKPHALVF
jgi:DNA-binding SARP family transcriptional activator